MRPYYADDLVTLYQGDAWTVVPELAAWHQLGPETVIVTDPPYGVGMDAFNDVFPVVRVLDHLPGSLMAVFMSPRRIMQLDAMLDTWSFERILTMHKTADMAAPWRGWCMNSESILLYSRPGAKWPERSDYRSDVYAVGPWERTAVDGIRHPNAKPMSVVRDLVRRLARPGATVVDPFAGSGTTLRAALDLGIPSVGVEIKPEFCRLAVSRFGQGVLPLMEGL